MGTLDNAIRQLASRIDLSGGPLVAWDRYQKGDAGLQNAVAVAIEDGLPASYISRALFQVVGGIANGGQPITLASLQVAPATPALTLRQAEDYVDNRAAWNTYLAETAPNASPAALRRAEEFVDAQVTSVATGNPLPPPPMTPGTAPPPAASASTSTAFTAPATESVGLGELGTFSTFDQAATGNDSEGLGGGLVAIGLLIVGVIMFGLLLARRG